ncbi:hypothetical protein [Streptomyces kaempferi]|uniref:Uncharacterized protein n=1 Tax=Streptomyces kaempferi TaxID=333725 RepID=A0ABW3XLN4_9ACTN
MTTRDELLEAAASTMRRGLQLNAEGADPSHPDYAKVMPAQHAAAAAGITPTEIWVAATADQ